jgi:hypothetical protein
MKNMKIYGAIVVALLSSGAAAEVCDYRPSRLLGESGAMAAEAATTGAAVAGGGMKAAGFYTMTHAATGSTMLASTLPGASAAGTVGIIGGTGGGTGAAAGIAMSPYLWVPAAALAIGGLAFEGGCWLVAE